MKDGIGFLGLLVFAVGIVVSFGWILDIPQLKSVLPGLVTMKANTAFAFILIGLSLFLQKKENPDKAELFISRLSAFIAGLIGLLTLAEYAFGVNLGIDQMLVPEAAGAAHTVYLGRMSPNTALCFFLLAFALIFLDYKTRLCTVLFQFACVLSVLISANSLIGYLYGVVEFYGQIWLFTPMALHTTIVFIVAGGGDSSLPSSLPSKLRVCLFAV